MRVTFLSLVQGQNSANQLVINMIQSFILQTFTESNFEIDGTKDAIINVIKLSQRIYAEKSFIDSINYDSKLIMEILNKLKNEITAICNERDEIKAKIILLGEIINNLGIINEAVLIETLKFKTLLALHNTTVESKEYYNLKNALMELEIIANAYKNISEESNQLSLLSKKFDEISMSKSLINEDFYSLERLK